MGCSLVLRRTHMYAALFLTPWMLIYALSTMAMNHRDALRGTRRWGGLALAGGVVSFAAFLILL